MVADLHQHRRHGGLAHLPQGGGRADIHLIRQRIDGPQILHDQLGATPAVGGGGIVKGDDTPGPALAGAVAGGVGVEGQIEVVVPLVPLPDGCGGGGGRIVATKADAIGPKIRLHGVGDLVHPVLLAAAAGDIGIILLGGGTQKYTGHDSSPFGFIFRPSLWFFPERCDTMAAQNEKKRKGSCRK